MTTIENLKPHDEARGIATLRTSGLLGCCRNCKHWSTQKTYGPVCADGEHMSEQGPRKLLYESVFGNCAKIVTPGQIKKEHLANGNYDAVSPLDVIVGDAYSSSDQWGSGGSQPPEVGPDFGCIHFEAKHPNSD